jgi:hypothetical protein
MLQPTSDPNTNDWYVFIYDYYSKCWVKVYQTSGNFLTSYAGTHSSNPQLGWSLDEAHFNANAYTDCPSVPTLSETGIQMGVESGSDSANYWRALQSLDYYSTNVGECFSNDGSPSGAIYTFSPYYDQWGYPAWHVTDPHPMPSPTRTPGSPCQTDPHLCESPVR